MGNKRVFLNSEQIYDIYVRREKFHDNWEDICEATKNPRAYAVFKKLESYLNGTNKKHYSGYIGAVKMIKADLKASVEVSNKEMEEMKKEAIPMERPPEKSLFEHLFEGVNNAINNFVDSRIKNHIEPLLEENKKMRELIESLKDNNNVHAVKNHLEGKV